MALRRSAPSCTGARSSLIPGGVNSPVRAMRAVGLDEPLFVRRGEGAYLEDVEGTRYLDWVMSWGPLLFGHADPETVAAVQRGGAARHDASARRPRREVELAAEIVDAVPSIEKVRLVSSGTEAAMSAIRLARGCDAAATGSSSSPAATTATPTRCSRAPARGSRRSACRRARACRGASPPTRSCCPYNDIDGAAAAVARYGEGLAAIVVEPVAGQHGRRPARAGLPRGAARALRRVAARCSSSTR